MRAKRRIANDVIGSAIRRERRLLGWTQGDLADEVGMPRTTMANIEAGRHGIAVDQLIEITDVLGTPLALLFAEVRQAWERRGEGH